MYICIVQMPGIKYKEIWWAMVAVLMSVAGRVDIVAQVNAEQVINIGRNVLSMDDYVLSIQYFNQAIKAKPYLSDPYYYRAIAKLSLEDYPGAVADCNLAIERNKFKTEAYKVRGFALQQLGQDSLAIADYDVGLEYNPHDKYFLFYKGAAQTSLKKYEEADTTFSTLLRLYPKFETGYAELARMNLLRGDTLQAVRNIDKTIELSRSVTNAYLMRAEIASKQNDWETAMSYLNEAIRLEPQNPELYMNRAYLHYNLDNFFGAMSDYNYILEMDPGNAIATYNRALLLAQVRDYNNAVKAFTAVLSFEPDNFHAIYNRALILLELGKYKAAESDFRAIIKKYPRFYVAYYGIAKARQGLGDMRGAIYAAHDAEELVRKYVKNPRSNPLDRPMISSLSVAADHRQVSDGKEESDIEVMERFNRLVTASGTHGQTMGYNEKIKGRVQDRDWQVEPEKSYTLSFEAPEISLRSRSDSFKELDEFNGSRYLSEKVYLRPRTEELTEEKISGLFSRIEKADHLIATGKGRPADYFARGVLKLMLKNFIGAEDDFTKALELSDGFVVAQMGRAIVRQLRAASDTEDRKVLMGAALSDYDMALAMNPELAYAWFNKGNLYYDNGDYVSAIACYGKVLEIDPDLGQAYYNRGLSYLQAGNKSSAFKDLGKAGELGVVPSYNILKRMK